jgi:hypothetical protein
VKADIYENSMILNLPGLQYPGRNLIIKTNKTMKVFKVNTGNTAGMMRVEGNSYKISTMFEFKQNQSTGVMEKIPYGVIFPKNAAQEQAILKSKAFAKGTIAEKEESAPPTPKQIEIKKVVETAITKKETSEHPFMKLFSAEQHEDILNTMTHEKWLMVRDNVLDLCAEIKSQGTVKNVDETENTDTVIDNRDESEKESNPVEQVDINKEIAIPEGMKATEEESEILNTEPKTPNYDDMSYPELKKLCKDRGLPTTGKTEVLIKALKKADK